MDMFQIFIDIHCFPFKMHLFISSPVLLLYSILMFYSRVQLHPSFLNVNFLVGGVLLSDPFLPPRYLD